MKRFFNILAIAVAVWLFGSFAGVMFDGTHQNLWTQSLMWALLSCVILAPVFLFVWSGDSSSEPTSSQDEPFDVEESMEVNDQGADQEAEGWPYTSEQKESGSSSTGTVTPNN